MLLFGKLRERFRNHTRDDLCASLRTLGIDAKMAYAAGRKRASRGKGDT